jgi:[ribosomal protein S18]-alanine N-acetyltransferase
VVEVRLGLADAAAAIARLHARCFPDAWSETAVADLFARGQIFALLIGAPELEGFALGRVVSGEGEVLSLAVAPECRRRGLGDALLRALLGEAVKRGAGRLLLEVAAKNDAGIALYRRHGFQEIGRRSGYIRTGQGLEDALVLSLTLAP